MELKLALVPNTPTMKTPREVERERKQRDYHRMLANAEKYKDRIGSFLFLASDNDLITISPQSAARFVFLCSYLKFGTDRLYITQRTPMKVDDLPGVLCASTSTVRRFLKEMIPKYMTVTKDGALRANTNVCRRSSLEKGGNSYHRVYAPLLRAAYYSLLAGRVQLLGYIFQAVRYLDMNTNMICIRSKSSDEIVPMTGFQFAEAVKYSPREVHRLHRYYQELTAEMGMESHKLILFSSDTAPGRSNLYVNPCLMTSSDYMGEIISKLPFLTVNTVEEEISQQQRLNDIGCPVQ